MMEIKIKITVPEQVLRFDDDREGGAYIYELQRLLGKLSGVLVEIEELGTDE